MALRTPEQLVLFFTAYFRGVADKTLRRSLVCVGERRAAPGDDQLRRRRRGGKKGYWIIPESSPEDHIPVDSTLFH